MKATLLKRLRGPSGGSEKSRWLWIRRDDEWITQEREVYTAPLGGSKPSTQVDLNCDLLTYSVTIYR